MHDSISTIVAAIREALEHTDFVPNLLLAMQNQNDDLVFQETSINLILHFTIKEDKDYFKMEFASRGAVEIIFQTSKNTAVFFEYTI